MSYPFIKHKLKRVGASNELLTSQYQQLMDKINKLEDNIDQSIKGDNQSSSNTYNSAKVNKYNKKENKKKKKNKKKNNDKDTDKNKDKNKKLCVFKNCPQGSNEKNTILFGKLSFGDNKKLCTFQKCPKSSVQIGSIGHHKDTQKLCGFDSCPIGSYELSSTSLAL